MLDKVDLSKKADRKLYKKNLEQQEIRLALLQRECKAAGIPIIILFEGFGASGKGTQINRLMQPLDPRGFSVYASKKATEEERRHPFLWRFWNKIPPKGRMAFFIRSWYQRVTVDRFDKMITPADISKAISDINSFEKQLTDDGMVIIKLFLYISKEEQKRRFKLLEASEETAWRVTKKDKKRLKGYERYFHINEEMLEQTDTKYAPWTIVEATDKDFATLKIMDTIGTCLEAALQTKENQKQCRESLANQEPVLPEAALSANYKGSVLSGVDLSKCLDKKEYKEKLDVLNKKMFLLHSQMYQLQIPMVLAFEGWDASGKGGAIKRLTSHLDPRGYQVNPIAAPNDFEKVHHYLWRFWRQIPKSGHIGIFDRTWYGRVLVERVEGFAREEEWLRAYQEINEMEAHLAAFGTVVVKFWLHIDKDEQEKRFNERMDDPLKQWKITEEDWRNREKWDQYEEAVNDMLLKTSTSYAPWVVVEGNNKYYARIKILETVVDAMERKIKKVTESRNK